MQKINSKSTNVLKIIGKNIRHFRQKKGLNQKELADLLQVTWETVSRWENGRVSPIKKLNEIADQLEIPINYLLSPNAHTDEQENKVQDKIPYLGEIPANKKEFKLLFKRTLFILDLNTFFHDAFAIKAGPYLQNLTNIPTNNNTILIVIPTLDKNASYFLGFDKKSNKICLINKADLKNYEHLATIMAIILQ